MKSCNYYILAKPIRPGQHYSPVGTTMSVLTSAMQSSIRGGNQPNNTSSVSNGTLKTHFFFWFN